jgi:hypothetical protein
MEDFYRVKAWPQSCLSVAPFYLSTFLYEVDFFLIRKCNSHMHF